MNHWHRQAGSPGLDDAGNAAVEAALVVPFLILLLLGIADGAVVALASGALEHAAWAAQLTLLEGGSQEMALAAAQARLRTLLPLATGDLAIEGDTLHLHLRVVGNLTRLLFGTNALSASLAPPILGVGG